MKGGKKSYILLVMALSVFLIFSLFRSIKMNSNYVRNEIPPIFIHGVVKDKWKYMLSIEVENNVDFNGIKKSDNIFVSLEKNLINNSAKKATDSEKEKFLNDMNIGDVVTVMVTKDSKMEDNVIFINTFSNIKKGV